MLDLIVAHANGLSVLPGNGTGGFGAQSDIVTGVSPVALAGPVTSPVPSPDAPASPRGIVRLMV